ncbi:MAG: tetratricopeptide repeat protein [Thermoplasmata archaeon]|jgi:tetratricopeptide (TPR) repeat protein|nr:tetratricopeptide repeat protein [Thermoplasmata archaeon]
MPCIKCGAKTEEEALLCDGCADACLQDPKFFLDPVLVGQSVFTRLRGSGSAAYILGPNTRASMVNIPSSDLMKTVKDVNVQALLHDDLGPFYEKCVTLLAHYGVPLRVDSPKLLLTKDAADAATLIIQKTNATEKMYPLEGMSDLYIRLGVVYWCASQGILMRTTSKTWREARSAYLVSKAKELLSKVQPGDDLRSIAARTLGLICLDAEEWTEAEEHLSEALLQFPDDLIIGEGLAKSHLMLGNPMEALSRVDEVINQGERPELWVLKGRILRDLDRNREALECFSRAISIDSHYMPAHDIMIMTLRDVGRLEEAALAESQRSLARRPDLDKKVTDLIAEFKKPSPEAPPPPPVAAGAKKEPPKPAPEPPSRRDPLEHAREALAQKDYDTAIQRASHLLREKPEMRDAILLVIEAQVAKGDVKEAGENVHSFYEKNKDDPMAWYWRGTVANKEGRWGASVQYFSKAVTLDPRLLDAWNSMGEILLANGKTTGADESFNKALEIDPEDSRAWLGKAKTMKALGRWGAAIQSFDKYNALVPGDVEVWKLKADLLFEKEKHSRAIEAYDKYLELKGADSDALCRKGVSLNALGMVAEAKKAFVESFRIDPNNKEAAKWLKALTGGES